MFKLAKKRLSVSGFTLVELLVVITIIGVLVTIIVVAVSPIQRKSRDARRKSDVNLALTGLNLFKADFKVYPNYTMYLGTNVGAGAKNSNLDLGGDLPDCQSLPDDGNPSNFVNPPYVPGSYDSSTLKPGFVSVNHFLMCLSYVDRRVTDPKPNPDADTEDDYHYRVSYDYGDAIVSAKLEVATDSEIKWLFVQTIPKRYYLGSGMLVRHIDEDSNITTFFNSLSGTTGDGLYLYQCKHDGTAAITEDNRVNYEPIVANGSGGWTRNTSCNNVANDLHVVASK